MDSESTQISRQTNSGGSQGSRQVSRQVSRQTNSGGSQSNSSSIVSDGRTTKVTVTANGRTCQAEVSGPVASVRTVTVNSQSYIEITHGDGTKRRVPCG